MFDLAYHFLNILVLPGGNFSFLISSASRWTTGEFCQANLLLIFFQCVLDFLKD